MLDAGARCGGRAFAAQPARLRNTSAVRAGWWTQHWATNLLHQTLPSLRQLRRFVVMGAAHGDGGGGGIGRGCVCRALRRPF